MDHVPTNIDRSRSPLFIPFAILGFLSLMAALGFVLALLHEGHTGPNKTGDAVPAVANLGPTSFANTGPFGVGVTTLHLSNDGAPVEVWYPALADGYHGNQATYNVKDYLPPKLQSLFPHFAGVYHPLGGIADVPMASGKFPVVVFSHGYAGFNTQSSFLTSHLASWGFVVAAPEHVTRDLSAVLDSFLGATPPTSPTDVEDLSNTITLMNTENQASSSRFYNHLDMTRVGAVGHSAGGAAVEKLAVVDHRVKVFVGLAGASVGAFGQTTSGAGSTVPDVPGLLESGTADKVVPTSTIVSAYNALHQPKRFISITNAGHLVFSDICELAPGQGGLIGVAAKIHLTVPAKLRPLGSDGCQSSDLAVTDAWPAINQSVTAELRWALGFDQSQAGLTGLTQAFSGVVGTNTTAATTTTPN